LIEQQKKDQQPEISTISETRPGKLKLLDQVLANMRGKRW
jgi:hypothetical protein